MLNPEEERDVTLDDDIEDFEDYDDYDDFKDFDIFNIFGLRHWNGEDVNDMGEDPEPEGDVDVEDDAEDPFSRMDPEYYNQNFMGTFVMRDILRAQERYGSPRSSAPDLPDPIARLYHRLKKYGFDSLSFAEQIEMILYCGMPGEDTDRLAELGVRIAEHFGSMTRFLFSRKKAYDGLGLSNRMLKWLLTTTYMVRTYLRIDKREYRRIFRHIDLMRLVGPMRHKMDWPSAYAMYADYDYHIIGMEKVANSNHWTDPWIVRHIVRQCVGIHARYLFIMLFCGPDPVELDDREKEYLVSFAQVLKAVNVLVIDFLIVSEFGIHSLSFDDKFDITHREADWRRTHMPFLPNWNTPPGMVGPEIGDEAPE